MINGDKLLSFGMVVIGPCNTYQLLLTPFSNTEICVFVLGRQVINLYSQPENCNNNIFIFVLSTD